MRRVLPTVPVIAIVAWVALRLHQANLVPEEYLAAAGVVLVATDRSLEGTRLEELELPALGAAWVALN